MFCEIFNSEVGNKNANDLCQISKSDANINRLFFKIISYSAVF